MLTKICSRCKRELPLTVEYFHRWSMSKDGFKHQCKECRGGSFGIVRINQVFNAKPGHKFCTKCRSELPISSEYFKKLNCSNDGYDTTCKKCQGTSYGVHKVTLKKTNDGYKICTKCERKFPATTDYFYKDVQSNDNFSSHCKECKGQKFGVTKFNPHIKDVVPNDYYICRCCKQVLPLNADYFSKEKQSKTGYKAYCKKCTNQKRRDERKHNIELYRVSEQIKSQKRRALKRKLISSFSNEQWNECIIYFKNSCAYCGSSPSLLTQDHIVPVTKGGHYIKQNIIPVCRSCNSSKNNNEMDIWYRKQPFFSEERLIKIHKWMGVYNKIQQLKIL
jgi:hypothetical protein